MNKPFKAPTLRRVALPNDDLDLTPEQRALCDRGHEALAAMKKTFDHWVTIGRALVALHDKAVQQGGRKTFQNLREQAGFGEIDGAVVTRLVTKVMPNLGKVQKWRASLAENQRLAWASPDAICRHCLALNPPKAKAGDAELKPSRYDKLASEHAIALEELHRLKQGERQVSAEAPTLDDARHAYMTTFPTDPCSARTELGVILLELGKAAETALIAINGELSQHDIKILADALSRNLHQKGVKALVTLLAENTEPSSDTAKLEPTTEPRKKRKNRTKNQLAIARA
jgi:hypothetical protein